MVQLVDYTRRGVIAIRVQLSKKPFKNLLLSREWDKKEEDGGKGVKTRWEAFVFFQRRLLNY